MSPPTEAPETPVTFVGQAPGVVVRQTPGATCCLMCCPKAAGEFSCFLARDSVLLPFFLRLRSSAFSAHLCNGLLSVEEKSRSGSTVPPGPCQSLTPFFSAETCPLLPHLDSTLMPPGKNIIRPSASPPCFPHFRSLFFLLLLLPSSILETACRDILPYKK